MYNPKIFLGPFFRGLINNLKRADSVIISSQETKLMCSSDAERESELPRDAASSIFSGVRHSRPVLKPHKLCQCSQTEAGAYYMLEIIGSSE